MKNTYSKVQGLTETLESVYLDYFNNFINVSSLASYYGLNITEEEAKSFLHVCRNLYNRNIEEKQ